MPYSRKDVETGSGKGKMVEFKEFLGQTIVIGTESAKIVEIKSAEYGTSEHWQCEVIVCTDSSFESKGRVTVFATVIERDIDDVTAGDGPPFVIGTLAKKGRAYILEPIPDDKAHAKLWTQIEKAMNAFEPFPDED